MKTFLTAFMLTLWTFSVSAESTPDYRDITEKTACTIAQVNGGDCKNLTESDKNILERLYRSAFQGANIASLTELETFSGALEVCAQYTAMMSGRACNPNEDDAFFCSRPLRMSVFPGLASRDISKVLKKYNPASLTGVIVRCDE